MAEAVRGRNPGRWKCASLPSTKVLLKRGEIRYITHQEKDKIENKITKNTSGEMKWKI
ncbi:MAG: hypothetical protein WC524_00385 [Candidatus Aminicenantales bacterium]